MRAEQLCNGRGRSDTHPLPLPLSNRVLTSSPSAMPSAAMPSSEQARNIWASAAPTTAGERPAAST
eukprot:scaffold106268_cov31-Tisochrysis_lutea.AAC.2